MINFKFNNKNILILKAPNTKTKYTQDADKLLQYFLILERKEWTIEDIQKQITINKDYLSSLTQKHNGNITQTISMDTICIPKKHQQQFLNELNSYILMKNMLTK